MWSEWHYHSNIPSDPALAVVDDAVAAVAVSCVRDDAFVDELAFVDRIVAIVPRKSCWIALVVAVATGCGFERLRQTFCCADGRLRQRS